MHTDKITSDALQARHAELQLLYDTIADLSSTLSVREVLDRLLNRVLDHLQSEIASILMLDGEGRLRIVTARGLPEEVVDGSEVVSADGISGLVAETGEPILVENIETDPRFLRRNHERYYTKSLLSAPLIHDGAPLGVINVNNKRSQEPYSTEDLRLLEAIAGHASVALANARKHENVLQRAQRDSLTGLANHGHMWTILKTELSRSQRYGRDLCLVMTDVDKFKSFNDRYGHLAGDEALCAVARELEKLSRAHDVVARYGGEEFAVILPETSIDGGEVFAEKVRQAVEDLVCGDGRRGRLTISAGVATSRHGERSARELVAMADQRLFQAKRLGRNRWVADDD